MPGRRSPGRRTGSPAAGGPAGPPRKAPACGSCSPGKGPGTAAVPPGDRIGVGLWSWRVAAPPDMLISACVHVTDGPEQTLVHREMSQAIRSEIASGNFYLVPRCVAPCQPVSPVGPRRRPRRTALAPCHGHMPFYAKTVSLGVAGTRRFMLFAAWQVGYGGGSSLDGAAMAAGLATPQPVQASSGRSRWRPVSGRGWPGRLQRCGGGRR